MRHTTIFQKYLVSFKINNLDGENTIELMNHEKLLLNIIIRNAPYLYFNNEIGFSIYITFLKINFQGTKSLINSTVDN